VIDICSINRYGFSDEELFSLIGMPTNKMIELLIKLNQLADSKINHISAYIILYDPGSRVPLLLILLI